MSVLEVKNIEKSFGKVDVLKGISFSLEAGEVISIIGSSGSGKTTLLRCLNFLETPDNGTISVKDEVLFDGSVKKGSKIKFWTTGNVFEVTEVGIFTPKIFSVRLRVETIIFKSPSSIDLPKSTPN